MPDKLIDDIPWEASDARNAGWRVDHDQWWTRRRRAKGDYNLIEQSHLGFTTDSAIYLRLARYCLAYDKGNLVKKYGHRAGGRPVSRPLRNRRRNADQTQATQARP